MTALHGLIGHALCLARRLLLTAAVAASVCVFERPAVAQFGMSADMGGATQSISTRGLEGYAKILNLGDDQKTAARALLDAHQATVRAVTEKFQKDMRSMQAELMESQDIAEFQKQIGEKSKAMGAEIKALDTRFFEDLKAVLDDEQAERWPRLERFRRRETMLRFGMVSGAGVDLIAALERAKVDPDSTPGVSDLASRYETEMDQLLVVMERDQQAQQERMLDGGAFDMANIQKVMKEMAESAIRVRDLNRETHRKLLAAVPEDKAAAYAHEFNRRSFPRVYRTSHTSKLLKAAGGFADLTESQRADVERMLEEYSRNSAVLNEKWAKAIEAEEEAAGGTVMAMMNGFSGQGANPEVAEARKARRDLDKQAKERLLELLTPAQQARLPEPSEPKDGGMGMWFGVDEEEE